MVQLLGVALAFAMVATFGLALIPTAQANWTGAAVVLAPGKYTGTNIYVPGEQMEITLTATPGDVIDLLIEDSTATYQATIGNQTIGTSGARVVPFTVPTTWPDGSGYQVRATDTTSAQLRIRFFSIETYNVNVWTDRGAYLPGDSVTAYWAVTSVQNGSLAPSGIGVIEAYDLAGTSLLTVPQFNFTAAQGSFSFVIPSSEPTGSTGYVELWYNDTAGLRQYTRFTFFDINGLGIILTLSAGTYAPGGVVTASIYTKVAPDPANPDLGDPAAPDIPVSVNVTDLGTGNIVAGYSATGLVTDSNGYLSYVFQLDTTPTSGDYEIDATATAHGTMSATTSASFTVKAVASLSVQITLDKRQYASGDTIHATAQVFATGSPTVTYTWQVSDWDTGNVYAYAPGSTSSYSYPIPTNYEGTLMIWVEVNDGNGTTARTLVLTDVAFGYLALSLDKTEFNPGDSITATFSLQSNVITNPTYFWEVKDGSGVTASAGSTTGTSATFTTPNPASDQYTFVVTASQNGRTVQAQQTSYQVSGYFLSITVDRASYNPGDTITISYTMTVRGTSALPSIYRFAIGIVGMPFKSVATTSATGTLYYVIPAGAPQGNEILEVVELTTYTYTEIVVHVGPVNPLVMDVAGVPLFDILIFLLFVVLLLAVILLWRRTGMGRAPPSGEAGKPTTPPPPPPSGPSQQAGGPMSVACKHCGANIEITTSKRPIEVMCPSCGETQVVQ